MTNHELVNKAIDIADNYNTLYVMGCFGSPLIPMNKERYIKHNQYNARPTRQKLITDASFDTFGFDCINLIKGIVWGWNGDTTAIYGGAGYAINNCPDYDADSMINICKDVSSDFDRVEVGEMLWTTGHAGIYIGKGEAIECTPIWDDGVQHSFVKGMVDSNYKKIREWKKHGKLPFIEYVKDGPVDIVPSKAVQMRYNSLSDVPECYRIALENYAAKGALKGRRGLDAFGMPSDIDLTEDMCRILTIIYRMYGDGK